MHNDLSTHLLRYLQTDPPENKLHVYRHASLSSNHKDLPVITTTCAHVHRCTRSGPYAFIFILSFRLTVKIYPSTVLLFYMSTDVLVHQYTCSVYFLFFCISYAMTFQLIYCSACPQMYLNISLPVRFISYFSA